MYDEARRALAWGYDKAPDLFSARRPESSYDAEMPQSPRKASPKKIPLGINVDDEGYIIHSKRMVEWYRESQGR